MDRKDMTKSLSNMLEKFLKVTDTRVYWAKEVTFDYSSTSPKRVDYMKFEPLNNSISGIEKGEFYCYEIKSSVEDFKSKHGHNFLGDYNYYVMTKEVYNKVKKDLPYHVGVYTPVDGRLKCVKQAKRKNRQRATSEMLLMMFRSANRELIKKRTVQNG